MWHFVWVCVQWAVAGTVVWGAFRAGMAVSDSDWRSHGDDLCRGRQLLESDGRRYYVLREEDYVKLMTLDRLEDWMKFHGNAMENDRETKTSGRRGR